MKGRFSKLYSPILPWSIYDKCWLGALSLASILWQWRIWGSAWIRLYKWSFILLHWLFTQKKQLFQHSLVAKSHRAPWLSMRVWKGHGFWPNLGMSTSVAPLVNINQFIANWTPRKWNLGLRRMMSPSRSGPAWIILRPGDLDGDNSGVNGRDFFVILRFFNRLDDIVHSS